MIIVKENIDLDKLLDYGFEKNQMNIYVHYIEYEGDYRSAIVITENKIVEFYYYDDLDDNKLWESVETNEGDYVGEYIEDVQVVDYSVPIPDVIFKLIIDGIVEVI